MYSMCSAILYLPHFSQAGHMFDAFFSSVIYLLLCGEAAYSKPATWKNIFEPLSC